MARLPVPDVTDYDPYPAPSQLSVWIYTSPFPDLPDYTCLLEIHTQHLVIEHCVDVPWIPGCLIIPLEDVQDVTLSYPREDVACLRIVWHDPAWPDPPDYPAVDGLPLDPAAILMRDVPPEEPREVYQALRDTLERFRQLTEVPGC
ncbi:MAG: hypothetical protein LIO78_04120 [Clostridiales bacterium]|nr:hypothetical protein [Clostridiales bacterium]